MERIGASLCNARILFTTSIIGAHVFERALLIHLGPLLIPVSAHAEISSYTLTHTTPRTVLNTAITGPRDEGGLYLSRFLLPSTSERETDVEAEDHTPPARLATS